MDGPLGMGPGDGPSLVGIEKLSKSWSLNLQERRIHISRGMTANGRKCLLRIFCYSLVCILGLFNELISYLFKFIFIFATFCVVCVSIDRILPNLYIVFENIRKFDRFIMYHCFHQLRLHLCPYFLEMCDKIIQYFYKGLYIS